jgi:hypothetical protein
MRALISRATRVDGERSDGCQALTEEQAGALASSLHSVEELLALSDDSFSAITGDPGGDCGVRAAKVAVERAGR